MALPCPSPTVCKNPLLSEGFPEVVKSSYKTTRKRAFRVGFQSPKMEASPIFSLRASISSLAGFSGFCDAARKTAGKSFTSPTELRKSPLWDNNQPTALVMSSSTSKGSYQVL